MSEGSNLDFTCTTLTALVGFPTEIITNGCFWQSYGIVVDNVAAVGLYDPTTSAVDCPRSHLEDRDVHVSRRCMFV